MLFSDPVGGPHETLIAELRDYPEWHCGRGRYGVWVVPVDDPVLLGFIHDAREQLADLIHPSPRRQPHLTVFVCGFHGEGRHDDDFPLSQLEHQAMLLESLGGEACELPLAALDSFAGAAFIPVGDPMGRIAHWRQTLAQGSLEIRHSPYVAHITLGLYRQCVSAAVLRQRLAAVARPAVSLKVRELHYVTYDARDQFGPLDCLRRITLQRSILATQGAQ